MLSAEPFGKQADKRKKEVGDLELRVCHTHTHMHKDLQCELIVRVSETLPMLSVQGEVHEPIVRLKHCVQSNVTCT